MQIVDKFIGYVKSEAIHHPEKSWNKILFGFQANKWRMKLLPNKNMAKGYQKLEQMMMSLVSDSLYQKERYVWGNIFAPCELIQCFDLATLSIECLACYMSGYHLEDYFIDYAQDLGIAPTLCSYHTTFVGVVESGVIKSPKYAVTTSLSCDGNLNTFRYLEKKVHVPFTFLDIPYEADEASVSYLADQLRQFARVLEEKTGKKFDENRFRKIIHIENETRKELKKFFAYQSKHFYPGELISHLYLMMGMHLLIGTQEFLELIRFMNEDTQTYPLFAGKKILWVHLMPYYQESLKECFGCSEKYQIVGCDMSLDYSEQMDEEHPFEALARKIIRNLFNGSYSFKADSIEKLADRLLPDAVIHFCHWGCKQASGGSVLLKERMQEKGIPMLILDGDGVDQRNSHDGQIKTRLEAFLEMIETGDEKTC